MNIEKRTAETPNPAETTPVTPPLAAEAPKQPAGRHPAATRFLAVDSTACA